MEDLKRTTRGQRPGREWLPVTRGVHRRVGAADPQVAELLAWQEVLPSSARFTHLTAARLYGWWLPPLPPDLPVQCVTDRDQARPTRSGLRVIRRNEAMDPRLHAGVRLDPPAETLVTCARDLSELDLLVLTDSALHSGSLTVAELTSVANERRRGAPALRAALMLCDARAESAWEVLLRRLHLALDVAVEPQREVWDETGKFLARADLWVVGTRMLHEYDGAHHLERRTQRDDLRRARALGNSGWFRRGYTQREVLNQPLTILRDADLTLGRRHDPARVRVWNALLRDSLFTPAGTARLRGRLGISRMGDLVS